MFRKSLGHTRETRLGGKDKKKLITEVHRQYPEASTLLLLGSGPVSELHLESRTIIYLVDNSVPVLFKLHGSSFLYPTVFGLNRTEGLSTVRYIVSEPVVRYLARGADLMLPGVNRVESVAAFDVGAVCAVRVDNGGRFVAIGRSLLSSSQLAVAENASTGVVGKAVEILHSIGDQIHQMGPKGQLVPPSENQQSDESPVDGSTSSSEVVQGSASPESTEESGAEKAQEAAASGSETMVQAQYDELVRYAVIEVLANIDKSSLPIQAAVLYSDAQKSYSDLRKRPDLLSRLAELGPEVTDAENIRVDIKKTSWRKVGKLLKELEKEGILKMKDKRGDVIITSISQGKEELQAHAITAKATKSAPRVKHAAAAAASVEGLKSSIDSELRVRVVSMYKPHQVWKPVLEASLGSPLGKHDFLSAKECRGLFQKYIISGGVLRAAEMPSSILEAPIVAYPRYIKGLEDSRPEETPSATSQNRSDVCVDARLASALSKGGKKVQPGASVSKAEIGKAFESKGLELYTAIVPPGSGDVPPADLIELLKYGPAPMITIRVTDKVSGNKTQTLIGGVDKYHLKLSDFAKALAKHNASSSTVRDDPVLGPNTVMVQGNVAQSVMHFLLDFVIRRSQDWFAALDEHPEELREYIQDSKTAHRLGHYFTCLLQFLLEHNPAINAKNVWCRQGILSDENHGELTSLKFLVVRNKTEFEDDNIPERFHLEASIHFSVTMSPKETDILATRFSGPFLYESLAWRIVETRRKLSVAEHPTVKQWLAEKCGGDVEHMWLLRGCVFYAWDVFKDLPQCKSKLKYELLGQEHPKGWWVQQDSEEVLGDILDYYGTAARFAMITHKRYWMSPSVGSDDGTELMGDEAIGIEPVPLVGLEGIVKSIHEFTEASSKRPVMVAVCVPDEDDGGRYVEASRGFILPNKWVVERDVSSESEDCHVETRSCAAFQESLYEILRKSGRVDSMFEAVKGIDLQDVRMCDQPKAPPKLEKPGEPLTNLNDLKDIHQWIDSISDWRSACIARHPPKKSGRGLGRAQSQRLRSAITYELNELMREEGSQAVSDLVLHLCLEDSSLGQEEVHAILEAVEGLRKYGWRCTMGRSLVLTVNKCLDDDSVSPMVIQKLCRCFDVEPSKASVEGAVQRYVARGGEDTAFIAGLRLLCQQCESDANLRAAEKRPDQAQLWNPVKGSSSRTSRHARGPDHLKPIVRGDMPLVTLSAEVPVKWVSSETELSGCVEDIAQYRTIGIDVEWSSGPGAALFQVATPRTVYLVDMLTPEIRQSSSLFSALIDVPRVLGFSISADVERIPQLKKCQVTDVQTDKRGSLQRHVAGQLRAYLDKTEQCSEWADRPLSESQKKYAALDAYTLLALDAHVRGVADDGVLGPHLFD
ncbi:hypothetical protein FOZ61_001965 [Perkinsus olseni]|uniref:SUI1 domain-containing protein n=1 Tax=Perkinsus olseni TaxID=32597 RepID=A0A7J6LTS8_PEROL|nr:hypothetical protein FOL46_005174 [Perkinsus olseni]KAF4663096.1 hypothetical protein FOZ61_001965 [Perkinsus olseni]